jgi:RHS repeat-associated protein
MRVSTPKTVSAVFVNVSRFSRHHFTGKERDTESGNDYFDARYYSSSMGRFMSPDWSAKVMPVPYAKLDDPQSLNLYAYVRNNPLTRVDADGHYECEGDEGDCHQLKKDLSEIKDASKSKDLTKDERKALKGVLKFYGKEGQNNGVFVNFGGAGEGNSGSTVTANGRTDITLNIQALADDDRKGLVNQSAVVTHEGVHGEEQQNRGGMPQTRDAVHAEEHDAYQTQSYVNKGMAVDSDHLLWTQSNGYSETYVNLYSTMSTNTYCSNPGACN